MSVRSVDVWASGEAYEQYVGRWSRLAAIVFVGWLAKPGRASWLDVGCGTGALSDAIVGLLEPRGVVGIDASIPYLERARRFQPDPRARFIAGHAQQLPLQSESFDGVVSGLLLNFLPRPDVALTEMARVVRRGGVVAAYVWDYAGRMELMRYFWNAAMAQRPAASGLDEGRRFPICRPDRLEALFRGAGLERVESRAIDVPTRFQDFDDYWSPFLGGQGPAPGYAMSLSEEDRVALRDRIRRNLPSRADGSIELVARAWAVRGSKGRVAPPSTAGRGPKRGES